MFHSVSQINDVEKVHVQSAPLSSSASNARFHSASGQEGTSDTPHAEQNLPIALPPLLSGRFCGYATPALLLEALAVTAVNDNNYHANVSTQYLTAVAKQYPQYVDCAFQRMVSLALHSKNHQTQRNATSITIAMAAANPKLVHSGLAMVEQCVYSRDDEEQYRAWNLACRMVGKDLHQITAKIFEADGSPKDNAWDTIYDYAPTVKRAPTQPAPPKTTVRTSRPSPARPTAPTFKPTLPLAVMT